MFKKLATIAAATTIALMGVTGSAQAAPSDCWGAPNSASTLEHTPCDVTKFWADGEFDWEGWYFYIKDFGRVFLNDEGVAYIRLFNGQEVRGLWWTDEDGDVRIKANDYIFVFRPTS